MALASSGSRSSIKSIEPLMSANSAVTVLRSPSNAASPTAVWGTLIGESFGFRIDAGAVAPTWAPHFLQNRAFGLNAVLHAGHTSSSFEPHCSQKVASAGLSIL